MQSRPLADWERSQLGNTRGQSQGTNTDGLENFFRNITNLLPFYAVSVISIRKLSKIKVPPLI
jgi:hypothetical protein